MPSDYEDLGIDSTSDQASEVLSDVLRAHSKDAVQDLEKISVDGVIRNVDYRSIDVTIMGKILQNKVEDITGEKIKPAIVEDMYFLALAQYLDLKDQEEFSGSMVHHDIISNFVDCPDIIEATRISRRNPTISSGVAVEFASSLIQELKRIEDQGGEEGANAKKVLQIILQEGGEEGEDGEKEDGNGKQKKPTPGDKEGDGDIPIRVLTKAGEQAKKQAETLDVLLKLAGTGNESSKNTNQQEVENLAKNSDVKEILKMVKGMPRIDIQRTIKYKIQRPGEKIDVVFGDNVTDARMSDFMLSDEEFYMNWLDRRLRNSLRGNPENFGPIYLLVDKSGSMDGEKVVWAKAVSLKLFEMARAEGRDFYLRFFDDSSHELIKVTGQDRRIRLETVRKICSMDSGGGTKIDNSLRTGIHDIRTGRNGTARDEPQPTVILITDGQDTVSHEVLAHELEKDRIYLISVMIKGKNESLEQLSHRYMEVQKLDAEGALKVVDTGIEAVQKKRKVKA